MDYAKIQELQEMLQFSDSQKIFEYAKEKKWIETDFRKGSLYHTVVFYMHRVINDLVYGQNNKIFNEFNYEYIKTTEKSVVEILQNLVQDYQILILNKISFPLYPLQEDPPRDSKPNEYFKKIFKENDYAKRLKKTFQSKNDKIIQEYAEKLKKYHEGQLTKTELLEDLELKGKLYITKDGTAVFHVSQILEQTSSSEEGNKVQTFDFIVPSVFEYFQTLYAKDENVQVNEKEYIAQIQFSCQDELVDLIKNHQDGAVDYIIRIAFLAYYKHSEIYSPSLFQDFLKITDEKTLRFRQENGAQHLDFERIAQDWWDEKIKEKKILLNYVEAEPEKDDDEEDMEKSREDKD